MFLQNVIKIGSVVFERLNQRRTDILTAKLTPSNFYDSKDDGYSKIKTS